MNISVLIPAYNPDDILVSLVAELLENGIERIVVVNDGSAPSCEPIFERIAGMEGVTVLRHAANRGKGAALKTGLNHMYCLQDRPAGVVTVDADGQHLVSDALKVASALAENPHSLILGVRSLKKGIPLRSYIGNAITRFLFRVLIGKKITDTQTGLRGIPGRSIPQLLQIEGDGYEFELDMLLMCKHAGVSIRECSITTRYENNNECSHFNPILDSMKIYFVLFRFSLASLSTSLLDYIVFWSVFKQAGSIAAGIVLARLCAVIYNYCLVKRYIFYSSQKHSTTLPKYLLLVLVSGTASASLIYAFTDLLGIHVLVAKIIAETGIFLANFLVQRDLIFSKSPYPLQDEESAEGLVANTPRAIPRSGL